MQMKTFYALVCLVQVASIFLSFSWAQWPAIRRRLFKTPHDLPSERTARIQMGLRLLLDTTALATSVIATVIAAVLPDLRAQVFPILINFTLAFLFFRQLQHSFFPLLRRTFNLPYPH